MKVVSLFSGAGGLDLGFTMAGHEIVWANDNFPEAVETYRTNLGDHIVCDDIHKIDISKIPDCDIVIGGFPCQGFSIANMKRHADDSRNELYKMLIKVIAAKRPKFFMAENVKGILTLEHGEVIKMIMSDFNGFGYRARYQILNAADYGVPQLRNRVIIVGVRDDVDFDFTYPSPTHNESGGNGLKKWVSVGDAMKDIPDPDQPNSVLNHTYSQFKLKFNGYIGNREIDPDRPAPTVTARGDDKGGVVVLHHPNNKRRMTCRELATVQGFPHDYEFKGNRSSIYRQIGNAVPPPLAKAIAEQFNLYKGD